MSTPATTPERSDQPSAGSGALGLFWLLASLGMLFLTTLVAFWVVRGGMELDQHTPIEGGLPWSVWVGTVLLVALSVVSERAARATGPADQLVRAATALSVVFVALQVFNWVELERIGQGVRSGLGAFGFFVLTALHAAHVIGGVVYQLHTQRHASQHETRRTAATYWHFLLLCWLLILATVVGTASPTAPALVGEVFRWVGWAALVGGVLCWIRTVQLIWAKDGAGFGVLALFPLFSVVFGWVRFQEHDNLRVMIAWQVCIALGMLGWIMSAALVA
jgi:cytochrome c oxidase subunit 3